MKRNKHKYSIFDDTEKFFKELKYMKRNKARNKARNRYANLKNEVTKSCKGNDPLGIPNVNFSIIDMYTDSDKDIKKLAEFKQQRVERGFDDTECWNLDSTVARFILPRLIVFKENTIGYPGTDEVPTFEAWTEILDKMIFAFEHIVNEDKYDDERSKKYGIDWCKSHNMTKQENGSYLMETNKEYEEKLKLFHEDRINENKLIEEGLALFGKHFMSLWW